MSNVMEKEDMEGKILTTLRKSNNSRGLYFKEIREITGLSLNTIAKYVLALEYKDAVWIEVMGRNKVVHLNKSPVEKKGRGS